VSQSNVNVVVITGNLTRDPELHHRSELAVCELRVAVNTRRRAKGGAWVDKANFFDVTVFGNQGENAAEYLSKGRPVAIEGRLDWQEWEAKDGSGKRQRVVIIASSVQFLGSKDGAGQNGNGGGDRFSPHGEAPDDTPDAEPAAVGAEGEDDIPF
jgi:single-strand DNA-binding protein